MTSPRTPEYTAEQVREARKRLSDAVHGISIAYDVSVSLRSEAGARQLCCDIRTVLSALSTAESEIERLAEEIVAARVTNSEMQLVIEQQDRDYKRVMAQAESAEQLAALKQGIIEAADARIRELASQLETTKREDT